MNIYNECYIRTVAISAYFLSRKAPTKKNKYLRTRSFLLRPDRKTLLWVFITNKTVTTVDMIIDRNKRLLLRTILDMGISIGIRRISDGINHTVRSRQLILKHVHMGLVVFCVIKKLFHHVVWPRPRVR
jgi:hypothetical protein